MHIESAAKVKSLREKHQEWLHRKFPYHAVIHGIFETMKIARPAPDNSTLTRSQISPLVEPAKSPTRALQRPGMLRRRSGMVGSHPRSNNRRTKYGSYQSMAHEVEIKRYYLPDGCQSSYLCEVISSRYLSKLRGVRAPLPRYNDIWKVIKQTSNRFHVSKLIQRF
jgi:hypothetical protein